MLLPSGWCLSAKSLSFILEHSWRKWETWVQCLPQSEGARLSLPMRLTAGRSAIPAEVLQSETMPSTNDSPSCWWWAASGLEWSELHSVRSLMLHLVFSELVHKTPCLRAFREGVSWLWLPMEDSVKRIALEMLFWVGAEAENLNVNQR